MIHILIGVLPSIAAAIYRHKQGLAIVLPNEQLSYVENFFYMLDKREEGTLYRTEPIFVKAMEILLILHAEHELNCSTAAVRHLVSSGVDIFSCISGAILALYGPKHGGANEAVIK